MLIYLIIENEKIKKAEKELPSHLAWRDDITIIFVFFNFLCYAIRTVCCWYYICHITHYWRRYYMSCFDYFFGHETRCMFVLCVLLRWSQYSMHKEAEENCKCEIEFDPNPQYVNINYMIRLRWIEALCYITYNAIMDRACTRRHS